MHTSHTYHAYSREVLNGEFGIIDPEENYSQIHEDAAHHRHVVQLGAGQLYVSAGRKRLINNQ